MNEGARGWALGAGPAEGNFLFPLAEDYPFASTPVPSNAGVYSASAESFCCV